MKVPYKSYINITKNVYKWLTVMKKIRYFSNVHKQDNKKETVMGKYPLTGLFNCLTPKNLTWTKI